MDRIKQVSSTFILLVICYVSSMDRSWAQESKIQNKLVEILSLSDKNQILIELSHLIETPRINTSDVVIIQIERAKTFFSLHQYKQGITAIFLARELSKEKKLLNLEAQSNKMLGTLYYYQGELNHALKAYQLSLAYYDNNQVTDDNLFTIERANLLNNIALVYTSLGKPGLSLSTYQLAEPLYARYGDETDKNDVRYNIATLHISLRRYDIAIDMLKVVIEKRLELNDKHGVAKARADLGVAYKHSGHFELGKENIVAALLYFQKYDYKHDIASQLHNLSELYNDIFDVEKALFYGEKALVISKEVGHQKAYAGSLQSMAKASYYSGNLTDATNYINQSMAVAKKIDYQILITENLAISVLISASKQNFVKALSELQRYEKSSLLTSNNLLNDKLAKFESEQLNQKIVELEQRRKLQNLEAAKKEQQRNVSILTLILILVVVFFIYRRYLEKRLTKELEMRVKQRTHELETLTEELGKANQVKSQFLANMSHEIRTPLTAIVGHAEAIIHDDFDKKNVIEDVKVIHGNSLHLLDLINNILDLSRIEANKFELEIQPLDISELIQDLSNTFSAQAQQKNLIFTIEHQLTLPFIVYVDNLRVKQILLNLCANAIKFTEKGQVTLSISWQDNQLTFAIKDTGIGLSKEHLAQVFDMFTQADNSISRRFGGSGLGLSLSNQLAKLMSGNIKVTSTLGEGSCFSLIFPCEHDDELAKKLIDLPEDNSHKALFSGTVLLAEDHVDNQQLIARLLTNLGLNVLVANNGKEAVLLCIKHQPTLTLLDIQMPEMDGVEAFKRLRELGCKQPIYALTANAMSHEIRQYLTLGFTGHLKKPIERKNFIATIAKHCSLNKFIDKALDKKETIEVNNSGRIINNISAQTKSEGDKLALAEENLLQVDLSDLITEFVCNVQQDKEKLALYSECFDMKGLTSVAHRLSGAAQMFGFTELSQAAKELENTLKSESLMDEPNQLLINDLTHCLSDEINLIQQK